MITICRLRPSTNPLQALMSENLDANCSLPGVSVYLLDSLWSRRDPKDPGINQGLGGEQKSKGSCFGPNDPKSYRRKKKERFQSGQSNIFMFNFISNLKLHYKTCQKNVKNKNKLWHCIGNSPFFITKERINGPSSSPNASLVNLV